MLKKRAVPLIMLFFVLATLAGILFISRLVNDYYVRRTERLERISRLHYLLCETLEPGMTKDEVFAVLGQTGDFTTVGDDIGPVMDLHIVFNAPQNKENYGAFNIVFSDYEYVAAYVTTGFEQTETICLFR